MRPFNCSQLRSSNIMTEKGSHHYHAFLKGKRKKNCKYTTEWTYTGGGSKTFPITVHSNHKNRFKPERLPCFLSKQRTNENFITVKSQSTKLKVNH